MQTQNAALSPTRINGEIWTVADAQQARAESGCKTLMLGRGALAAPDLARRIGANDATAAPMPWSSLQPFIAQQFLRYDTQSPRHVGNRTKQWLAYLKRTYPEATELFGRIRTLHDAEAITAQLVQAQPTSGLSAAATLSSDMSRNVLATPPNQPRAHSR